MWFSDLEIGTEYAVKLKRNHETRIERATLTMLMGPSQAMVQGFGDAVWNTGTHLILHTWVEEERLRSRSKQVVNSILEKLS